MGVESDAIIRSRCEFSVWLSVIRVIRAISGSLVFSVPLWFKTALAGRIDAEEDLAELDRLLVLRDDFLDHAAGFGSDFVEELHRLDQADHRRRCDAIADLDERWGFRIGGGVECAD